MTYLKLFLVALPIFFIIDMIWLGFVARNFYKSQLGDLMINQVNWVAAIIFYLIFIAGLVVFVIEPAVAKSSWQKALILGGFFGFVTYATYDLTNLATLKNWPLVMTIVDLGWGTVLGAAVSSITYFAAAKWLI